MTPEHRTDATLAEDGKLMIDNLPFKAGQRVAVIVQPTSTPTTTIPPLDLRGMVLRYDDPTAPVADSEWEVLQ